MGVFLNPCDCLHREKAPFMLMVEVIGAEPEEEGTLPSKASQANENGTSEAGAGPRADRVESHAAAGPGKALQDPSSDVSQVLLRVKKKAASASLHSLASHKRQIPRSQALPGKCQGSL